MDEFQLNPPLPLPAGQTEADIMALFGSVELEDAPKQELKNYWQQDWRRFVYTYGIVPVSAERVWNWVQTPTL